MNESGPIRKTLKEPDRTDGFADRTLLAPNIWRVSRGGKYLVLKTMSADTGKAATLSKSAASEYLRREWELTCNLNHPHIAAAYAFLPDTPEGPAIEMEYVEGRTLRSFVAEGPSVAARRRVLDQILDAVEYLHAKGLLHNDIKPENILVTSVGNDAKIIDFGLAESEADFLMRRLGGTEGASAPEVLAGRTDLPSTAASDVYSLGALIDLLLPHRYRGVVRTCLREAPERRYPDVGALRRALARSRRRPFVAGAVLVALLFLAVALVPGRIRSLQQQRGEAAFREEVAAMQEDLTAMFGEAMDSLRRAADSGEYYRIRNNLTVRSAAFEASRVRAETLPYYLDVYADLVREMSLITIPEP